MENNQPEVDKALKIQGELEKKILEKKDVQGLAVSTMPHEHSKICIKIITDNKQLTLRDLGVQESYEGIPIVISFEEVKPL